MLNPAIAVEKYRKRGIKGGTLGSRNSCFDIHLEVPEVRVHSDAVALVARHVGAHSVPHEPGVPKQSLRGVVGQLALVEVGFAAVAVPHGQVAERVFAGESVHAHVVCSLPHHKAVVYGEPAVGDRCAPCGVVGPPQPQVVPHHVPALNHHHALRLRHPVRTVGTPHSSEHVRQNDRVVWVAGERSGGAHHKQSVGGFGSRLVAN
mmetsp:Transcript_63588/g.127735  ORF Transcript_63588/g.127735 Transcript_63588/m.127735 type:complete len:205 (-) Transcript_63588:33-647(-)